MIKVKIRRFHLFRSENGAMNSSRPKTRQHIRICLFFLCKKSLVHCFAYVSSIICLHVRIWISSVQIQESIYLSIYLYVGMEEVLRIK